MDVATAGQLVVGGAKAVHANQFGSGGRIELIQFQPSPTPTPTTNSDCNSNSNSYRDRDPYGDCDGNSTSYSDATASP